MCVQLVLLFVRLRHKPGRIAFGVKYVKVHLVPIETLGWPSRQRVADVIGDFFARRVAAAADRTRCGVTRDAVRGFSEAFDAVVDFVELFFA